MWHHHDMMFFVVYCQSNSGATFCFLNGLGDDFGVRLGDSWAPGGASELAMSTNRSSPRASTCAPVLPAPSPEDTRTHARRQMRVTRVARTSGCAKANPAATVKRRRSAALGEGRCGAANKQKPRIQARQAVHQSEYAPHAAACSRQSFAATQQMRPRPGRHLIVDSMVAAATTVRQEPPGPERTKRLPARAQHFGGIPGGLQRAATNLPMSAPLPLPPMPPLPPPRCLA